VQAIVVCRKCGAVGDHYTLKCPYKDINMSLGGVHGGDMPPPGDDDPSGKYVVPSMRRGAPVPGGTGPGGSSLAVPDDSTSLRVTNLSEDVEEEELRTLFQGFGRIERLYLPRDRDTFQARGYAYISYMRREEADRARLALNGYPYDHLILRVEWARPSDKQTGGGTCSAFAAPLDHVLHWVLAWPSLGWCARHSVCLCVCVCACVTLRVYGQGAGGGGLSSNAYVSGYGKALPQTKPGGQ
jgi:hypothetical protein